MANHKANLFEAGKIHLKKATLLSGVFILSDSEHFANQIC